MKKYGYTKGSLQKASKEALKSWIMQQSDLPKEEDPFARVEGMLSRIKGKKTAVELQHEAKHQWMKSL